MDENWIPPNNCICAGNSEEILPEVYHRLRDLDAFCWRVSGEEAIYVHIRENPLPPDGRGASGEYLRYRITTARLPGNCCRLVFKLIPLRDPRPYTNATNWARAKHQIEQLLKILHVDGWIECRETEPDSGAASQQEQMAQGSSHDNNTSELEDNDVLPDVNEMKKFFPDYNPTTAKEILDTIVKTSPVASLEGKKLGATFLKEHITLSRETIQRYLGAFHDYGLKKWKGVPLS